MRSKRALAVFAIAAAIPLMGAAAVAARQSRVSSVVATVASAGAKLAPGASAVDGENAGRLAMIANATGSQIGPIQVVAQANGVTIYAASRTGGGRCLAADTAGGPVAGALVCTQHDDDPAFTIAKTPDGASAVVGFVGSATTMTVGAATVSLNVTGGYTVTPIDQSESDALNGGQDPVLNGSDGSVVQRWDNHPS